MDSRTVKAGPPDSIASMKGCVTWMSPTATKVMRAFVRSRMGTPPGEIMPYILNPKHDITGQIYGQLRRETGLSPRVVSVGKLMHRTGQCPHPRHNLLDRRMLGWRMTATALAGDEDHSGPYPLRQDLAIVP